MDPYLRISDSGDVPSGVLLTLNRAVVTDVPGSRRFARAHEVVGAFDDHVLMVYAEDDDFDFDTDEFEDDYDEDDLDDFDEIVDEVDGVDDIDDDDFEDFDEEDL